MDETCSKARALCDAATAPFYNSSPTASNISGHASDRNSLFSGKIDKVDFDGMKAGCGSDMVGTNKEPLPVIIRESENDASKQHTFKRTKLRKKRINPCLFEIIPVEILLHVMKNYLSTDDMKTLCQVSTKWRSFLLNCPSLWPSIKIPFDLPFLFPGMLSPSGISSSDWDKILSKCFSITDTLIVVRAGSKFISSAHKSFNMAKILEKIEKNINASISNSSPFNLELVSLNIDSFTSVHLKSLRSLALSSCSFSEKVLLKIIVGSPLLEDLSVLNCHISGSSFDDDEKKKLFSVLLKRGTSHGGCLSSFKFRSSIKNEANFEFQSSFLYKWFLSDKGRLKKCFFSNVSFDIRRFAKVFENAPCLESLSIRNIKLYSPRNSGINVSEVASTAISLIPSSLHSIDMFQTRNLAIDTIMYSFSNLTSVDLGYQEEVNDCTLLDVCTLSKGSLRTLHLEGLQRITTSGLIAALSVVSSNIEEIDCSFMLVHMSKLLEFLSSIDDLVLKRCIFRGCLNLRSPSLLLFSRRVRDKMVPLSVLDLSCGTCSLIPLDIIAHCQSIFLNICKLKFNEEDNNNKVD